jgi:tetratricopeptide (TPR) repeat protein
MLEGYVFREADGGPPLRPLTVELLDQGRSHYRETTGANGAFQFDKVRTGNYTLRARFNDFVIVEEPVVVQGGARNFAAVMLPKRWAGARTFRTVTADRLTAQSDRKLQKKLKDASELIAKQHFDAAIQVYEQAAVMGATADLWDGLGLLYLRVGKKEEAFEAFRKAIERDPNYLFPYAHLGSVYLEERRYKELMVVAKRAIAVDSKWQTAHALLAEAQANTAELESAQKSAETASELVQGKAPGPYLLLARIHWSRRNCDGARRCMNRYLELNPSVRELPETLQSLKLLEACESGQ